MNKPKPRLGQSWKMHRTPRTGDDRYWIIEDIISDYVLLSCVGTRESKEILKKSLKRDYTLHYDPITKEALKDKAAGLAHLPLGK